MLLLSLLASGQSQPNPADLTQMSLEDLLKLEVTTTIGKRLQKISQIPAAVYVISAEDIERAGATSVPEALRLAPGVEVAQLDGSTWAISIRGFNSAFSNKLLVLVDGRTVYSSIYTQVFWAAQDLSLQDVERIEVIRGPGAAIWGANAVNGVINIVTRSARDTQGRRLTLEAGSHDQAIADASYGGNIGRDIAFRVSSRYALRGQMAAQSGGDLHDRWDLQRASARSDWTRSPQDSFTLIGDIYQTGAGETLLTPSLTPPSDLPVNSLTSYDGGSLLLRWNHVSTGGSQTSLQAYYDCSHQTFNGLSSSDRTLDLDFHQEVRIQKRNNVLWGLGARFIDEDTRGGFQLSLSPSDQEPMLFSGFVQDEITLQPAHLWLTLGTKLEHNLYTGVEVQPDLRILWALNSRHSFWAAVSRAVRTPAAFEERGHSIAAVLPGADGPPSVVIFSGSPRVESEEVLAYEAGYRMQASRRVSFDLAAYYDLYQHLSSVELGAPFFQADPIPHLAVPLTASNALNGHSQGVEVSGSYAATGHWKFSGSYSLLRLFYHQNLADPTAIPALSAGTNPQHQFQVHSDLSLPRHWEFNTSAYFAGALPATQVPHYARLDVRLAWSALESLRLSFGGQNLLDPRHVEFQDLLEPAVPAEIPRSFYGKVEWKF